MKEKKCKRCGRCCRTTPPSLLKEDMELVKSSIDYSELYTIREGEIVWDNIEDKIIVSPYELIKIRENAEGECIFYSHQDKSCTIYEIRPVQCKEFFCMTPDDFYRVFEKPKLNRTDLFKNSNIFRLIEEHERKCNYLVVDSIIRSIEIDGEIAVKELIKLLQYDHEIRRLSQEKLGIQGEYLDLIFGRALSNTIRYYGFEVQRQDDTFYLTLSPDYKRAPS